MKKFLWLGLLGLAAIARADIAVTQGSGKTVATITNSSREFQQISASIDASSNTVTVGNASLSVAPVSGQAFAIISTTTLNVAQQGNITINSPAVTQSGTWTVQPGNTPNTTPWLVLVSTLEVMTGANVSNPVGWQTNGSSVPVHEIGTANINITAGSIANTGFNVNNTPAVSQSGTWNIGTLTTLTNPVTVVPGATNLVVTSTSAIPTGANTIGAVTALPGAVNLVVTSSSTQIVGGTAAAGAAPSGNPLQDGVLVTSTTIPTVRADGTMVPTAGSNIGQVLVTGVPYGLILSSVSTNISINTVEGILVSSPAAGTYTYLCGCIFNNSSATNSFVTLYQTNAAFPTTAKDSIQIGTPANDIPAGLWPGCSNPFFRSNSGGQITAKANASATSTAMRCQYYQGP